MTCQEPLRRLNRHEPDLLLAYLQYALNDVREFSERSGRQLELAINVLAEDAKITGISDAGVGMRPS